MSNFAFVPIPANWQKLSRHEFSADMGDMTEAEFSMLCADMEKSGFQGRPVLLIGNKTFEVADGWHQLRAAVVTGKTPSFERYVGNDLFGEIWRRHGPRKHWNESQRSMIAGKVSLRRQGGISGTSKSLESANLQIGPTQGEAAKTVNVSTRSVSDAVKVIQEGTPALQQAVMNGTVKVSDAAKIVEEPAKVQNAAVNAVKAGKAPTARAAVAARKPADDDPAREPGVEAPENAESVKDAEGETVPDHAIEAFVRADEITKLCREIDGILHRAEEIAKAPGGELIRFESVKQQLKDAKGNLWANRPTHVCPYCHGKKKSKPCECCKDRGWTSKLYWSQAPGNNEKAKR